MQRAGGLVVIGAAALLLSGCTGSGPVSSPPAVTVTASASSTPATTLTVTPTPTPSTTPASDRSTTNASGQGSSSGSSGSSSRTDPDAPEGQCADSDLHVTVQELGGGDGQRQTAIGFTNTGAHPCVLSGFPGVSLVGDGNGTQLGQAAARVGSTAGSVTVKPGLTVQARLDRTFVDATTTTFTSSPGRTASCAPKKADGYRIYPPHSFRAVSVAHPSTFACTTSFVWMHVGPVKATD